eukprot:GFUD01010543.1.p1 GENE.GFUD01010543.1~~GFUD01010543.1.p1  ORF type:complete len:233 (-),score=37.83 GFUD01010543.1:66-764(-)
MDESTNLWVFGYGSLVWKPGFQHGKLLVGYVNGFARRFWQGNETHRGTPGKPGRVATLIEEAKSTTYGVAMELQGEEALDYLNNREMTLGGYIQKITMFHTADDKHPPFPVLVFVATSKSSFWLGPAEPHVIAEQVVTSSGPSGHNVEYVLRLADWFHTALPSVHDEHLFSIEVHVRIKVKERNLCLKTIMGEKEAVVETRVVELDDRSRTAARRRTFAYTCEKKCMKCIKL